VVARSLDGKVALVTGGASGIGLATARRLLRAGARVVVVDVQPPPGDADVTFVHADVAEPREWPRIVDEAGGGVDVAHLNAGVTTGSNTLDDLTDEQYRRILRVNVDGVVFGARAVVPAMRARGGGAIVATASLAGLIAFSPDPIYTLTKHAVVGFVRATAPVLQADGITVNAVCPGLVDTPLLGAEAKTALDAAGFALIDPDAIAAAVEQCMTGDATGQAYVCQAGREPTPYRFSGVPGPASHQRPPAALADPNVL
jgi:NAD(P)-dependent dehydrogenase (short-subunit alcohol dehydrogenase family)